MSPRSEIAAPAEEDGPKPELLSRGQYGLYRAPDGGMHLAYRPDGAEEDLHLVVPAAMVRMAEAAAAGQGPFARMRALIGH